MQKAVHDIVGKMDALEVLRHFLQRTLAELLSNPRLETAVAARLKEKK